MKFGLNILVQETIEQMIEYNSLIKSKLIKALKLSNFYFKYEFNQILNSSENKSNK